MAEVNKKTTVILKLNEFEFEAVKISLGQGSDEMYQEKNRSKLNGNEIWSAGDQLFNQLIGL